jgi:hypothetical protein
LSKLPIVPELWDKLVAEYRQAPTEHLWVLSLTYGYKNVDSFTRAMRKRGIHRFGKTLSLVHLETMREQLNNGPSMPPPVSRMHDIPEEPEVKYVAYPEIKLMPFPQPKTDRDEEDMGVVLADWHLAKITESYNLDIAKTRVTKLTESIMKIVSLHAPIRKLHLFVTGDVVQGENTHQGSVIGSTSCGALEQVYSHAIPIYTELLLSLNQGIPEVELYGVDGNHGRYDKTAPSKTNWDAFFYESLKMALIQQPKIHVYPPRWFYQLINIRGFRFFIVHGDQVNVSNGIPLFALRRKMQEWYAYVDGFNYGYTGHFHSKSADQVNSRADYTICPPLVTGDEWALEKVGRASEPKQICFGIHETYGRTFTYDLICDKNYLPRKYNEPEGVVELKL